MMYSIYFTNSNVTIWWCTQSISFFSRSILSVYFNFMPCQEFYCLDDQDYWMNIRSYSSLKDSLYEILVCLFKNAKYNKNKSIKCRRTKPTSFYCTSTFAFTNIYSNFVFTKIDSLLLIPPNFRISWLFQILHDQN